MMVDGELSVVSGMDKVGEGRPVRVEQAMGPWDAAWVRFAGRVAL